MRHRLDDHGDGHVDAYEHVDLAPDEHHADPAAHSLPNAHARRDCRLIYEHDHLQTHENDAGTRSEAGPETGARA